jgi:mannose-6-phosphate isomerase-like protein (cupin superfamily)
MRIGVSFAAGEGLFFPQPLKPLELRKKNVRKRAFKTHAAGSILERRRILMADKNSFQRFNLNQVAKSFPDTAETMLLDTYLTDEIAASSRVFRVYRETPAHYHEGSDEYLYVLSGRGTFWMGDPSNGAEFTPGDLLFFKRRVVHALPSILETPVVFLAIDTPRRDPKDIIFVNPADGTPETFIRGREQPPSRY